MTILGLMQTTPLTIHSIFDRMRTVYADVEVVSPERTTTYGEIAERVLKLCNVLRDLGVGPGDRVATFAFNNSRHFELYYAVPLLGAILHTVNVRLFDEQISYIVNHANDKVMFVDAEVVDRAAEFASSFETVERYVRLGDGPASIDGILDHDELIASASPITELPEVDENAACGLCYTSGTTGMPKGVLYSHRATWLHAMATSMVDHVGLSHQDVVFPIVPMFHVFAWGLPYSAPFTGASLVFHGSDNSAENVGRIIEKEHVTVAGAVPTIWKEVLPLIEAGKVDVTDLRMLVVGGSAPPRVLIERYDDYDVNLLQVWGMTETGPIACTSRPRRHHRGLDDQELLDVRAKTGTIFSGLEARIVGGNGDELPWDGKQVGELEVRGPWIASSYYNDDSLSERFVEGDWFKTGDMALIEPDGYFKIVDRAKDLVKSGGEWISSVELECAILAHPQVRDAAVVGIPSKKWDERPVAVVVPDGAAPSLDSIHEFLSDKVAKWWLPDDVVVVDEIPKTSVGKIDKKAIRAQLVDMQLA